MASIETSNCVIIQTIFACIQNDENILDLSSLEDNQTEIPEHIFAQFSEQSLAKITELNADFNDFDFLPESISRLKSLRKLSVEGNSLHNLPLSLGDLEKLEELRLGENKLSEVPSSFASLNNLRVLSFVANQLFALPCTMFEALTHLEELYIDENQITELPENFGLLKSLKKLELSENKLKSLPEGFGDLHQLEVVNLSRNKLSELPSSFGDLGKLRSIDLSDNNLSALPNTFHSASTIENLYLDNNILGLLPEWFGCLSSIVSLTLNDNKLQGTPFPAVFPKVAKESLKKLEVGGNAISNLPDSIGELCHLELLHIGSTICELERRNFQNGNWIRELPENFGHLSSVKKLYLDENQLVKLPESFGDLYNLTWIDLGQNLLSYLPDSFCNLVLLEYCQLSKNELNCLPLEFGKLKRLKDLRLDSNMLKELPESCAKLQSLHTLDLFNNKLTKVPDWLSKLSSLRRLDLDSNNLNLKLKDIPHLVSTGSEYAKRDPSLKDNWRGKIRADKVRAEVVVIDSEDGTNGDDYDEDDASPTTYSEGALFAAMRRGLSIWRTHDGPIERQSRTDHQTRLEDVVFNVFEDVNDSSTNDLSGLYLKLNKKVDPENQDDGEDWDKEINETWGKTPMDTPKSSVGVGVGVDVFGVEDEKRNEFLLTLSAYPPASQAYTATATYESMACRKMLGKNNSCDNRCLISHAIPIHGQFEDAE